MNAFEVLRSVSPSDPTDEIGTFPLADVAAVDAAVSRARRAFPAWRDAGLENRAAVLNRFAELAVSRRHLHRSSSAGKCPGRFESNDLMIEFHSQLCRTSHI